VITQPRRLAAIKLAERVAAELGEAVGERVGYSIRGKSKARRFITKLLFVTTGWLLHKLIAQPPFIKSVTHLILDEIHVRSSEADMLCLIIKKLAKQYQRRPRLIITSANFDTGNPR